MRFSRKLIPFMFLAFVLMIQMFSSAEMMAMPSDQTHDASTPIQVDVGNGDIIEVYPDEELHKFVLTDQGWVEWTGVSDYLSGGEYGNRTDSFPAQQMKYLVSNSTTETSVEVPTGTDWEAYTVETQITGLTENRTWITNPDFEGNANGWTLATSGAGGGYSTAYSNWMDDGHGADDCIHFEIDSVGGGPTYYYDANDRAYAGQTMNIPRGQVLWAGFRVDYWADTTDDTHYGMTGSFSVYFDVEGTRVWQLVFDAIADEETWYDSGLVSVSPGVFNMPSDQSIAVEIGLLSEETVGYTPEIGPHARVDNVELYMKTRATPANVNLEMNGNPVTSDGWSLGHIVDTPTTPWTSNPVTLNFTWTPTPVNPNPNREIWVGFDVETNMFARRLSIPTVFEISPSSYGERFSIQNGTNAVYSTFFYANIPDGYVRYYYYNLSTPSNRDTTFVARPLAPSTNLTTGWTGGAPGDGYLNVSAYTVTTEAGRYGYWRIRSNSPNMITDLELYDPNDTTWKRNIDLRADDSSNVRVYVGSAYENSEVNISIFDPSGNLYDFQTVAVDSSGYATSTSVSFPGSTAEAGSWMVQAIVNDIGTNGLWRNTGFFKRAFTVTHASDIDIRYPTDAVGTWVTNVTYGDLLLVVIKASDTDSNTPIIGGTLGLDWALGTDSFDDSGNGNYTKVLDTSLLPGKGQYTVDLDWTAPSFDPDTAQLTINVNYATTLTSPDYPGISGAIGLDQSFTVNFRNINGTGISGGVVSCDWSGGYTATPLGGGAYEFELQTSGIPIGEYPVTINAAGYYVNPASMVLYIEIREIYNQVTYSANELSIPVGESASFQITWINQETGSPVTDGLSYISCNWTSFHSIGEQNYSITHLGSGVYDVAIFTEDDDPLTASDEFFTVVFNVERLNYQNHTFNIRVRIRSHSTLFILDDPVQQTEIGDVITVLVFYQDADLQQGITNDTFNVQILVTSPEIGLLQFTVAQSSLGPGHYNISIPSGQWGSVGWKNLAIYANWIGGVAKYANKVIDTRVRILGTDTDLFLQVAPTATYYLNTFSFSTVYYDVVNATTISNSSLGYNVILTITPITGGHPVTQLDFIVTETGYGTGIYRFSLDTSLFGTTGSFVFRLDFMWRKGITPLYENQTMTVTLVILSRPTYIDYIPVQSTPYGEIAEFEFSYIDSLTTSRIPDSAQLTISIVEMGVSYTYSFNALDTSFMLYINTTSLPGIGTHILHLSVTWVGSPFYQSIGSQTFSVSVTQRFTQLTHLSFAPGQWGNNVSIEFIYTDLVSGLTAGMTGTLTLNASLAGFYTVTYLGNGHFLVVLNTSSVGTDGLYTLTASIVHTSTNYASAIESFGFSVLKRLTQFGYESPDPAAYLENVTLLVTFVDDSTGRGISGASITVTSTNVTAEVLTLGVNYWVSYIGDGQYLIELNSDALGPPGNYILDLSVTYSGPPYYMPAVRSLNARVTERTTQIIVVQTPGETAFLENITLRFRFEDFLTGDTIDIDKTHITLSHGVGHTMIGSSDYSLYKYLTYYEISLNSTVLSPTSLVTSHEIQLEIDISGADPYYASRAITTRATTTERPTQILFPLVQEIPYFGVITIELEYIDFLTGIGIEGATVILDSVNWTVSDYELVEMGGGSYRLLVNSTVFGSLGTVYFDFTASLSGVPFYASRTTTNVPASIRAVQTQLIAETPSPGSTAVGVPIVVTLTLTDYDNNLRMEGASIATDWTTLYGTGYILVEISNGIYELTLDMTGLIAQDYPFTVQAEKQFYQTATILISVTPGASTFTLQLARTTVYAQWGELAEIRIDVRESYYLSLIPGANVTLFWNAVYYDFTDLNNGTYVLFLDTSNNNFGIYNPQISVSREYYQTRQTSLTLVVTKAPGQVVSEQTSYDVVINTAHEITIYLNDSLNSGPVVATSISLEWNNTIYPIAGNGTPGFYTFTIDVTGFDIGPYQAIISVAALNHQFLDYILDINVVPIPTLISHIPAEPAIFLIRGDQLIILVHYNDSYYGGFILGANVSYTIAGLTGSFIPEANGTYSAVIGTSSLAAQTFFLRIEGSRTGYSTATRRIPVTLLPVPTILLADKTFDSGHHNEIVEFSFYYNDTHNNQPITGALGLVSWEGGSFTAEEIGGGYYLAAIVLTPTSPRPYDISVTFSRQDYETASIIIRVQIEATPATVAAPASVSIPVNDTTVDHFVYLTVKSDLDNSTLTGFIGIAYWTTIGEVELSVNETSGDYYFQIDPFLPLGSYTVVVSFNTAIYDIDQTTIEVIVRPIATSLTVIAPSTSQIDSFPGDSILVSLLYFDLDHELGIDGANIQVSVSGGNVTYLEQFTQVNQGVYEMTFVVNTQQTFYITITLSKDQHMTGEAVITVRSDISGAQVLARNMALIGGFAFIFLAAFIVLYVRVYSVPRMIRILNKMIKAIAGGKIPKAPQVASRQESILVIVNEDLKSTGIQKTPDEVVEVPIIAVVPEVNELLERLAEITGLGDVELDAFRHDLSRMKASERPGFIREVIEQEEARRADALAKVKPEEAKEPKRESLEEMPSELEELRMKLKRKGMSNDEIDIIIDQAKSLSPADLEALLDSLGIKL